jgi:hypothetical protein
LVLEGTKSNRNGFGAQVRLDVGGRVHYAEARCPTTYASQSDSRLHFGLFQTPRVQRIEIRWPSGQVQTLEDIPADQFLKIREPGASRWPKPTAN